VGARVEAGCIRLGYLICRIGLFVAVEEVLGRIGIEVGHVG
jgi:hypothetical protein